MKSKTLVKFVLVFLFTSGIIVFLGTKAMVSAQVGFGHYSNESINAEFLDVKPWWSYRLTKPNPKDLLVQPKLTSTPSVSITIKSAAITPLVPLFFDYCNENNEGERMVLAGLDYSLSFYEMSQNGGGYGMQP